MQALTLPASRGVHWFIEGFSLFRRKSGPLTFLALGYLLSMALISAIISPIVPLLVPPFSVSLMNACRLAEKKQVFPPQLLFSGFHRNLQTLLALGAAYTVVLLLILGLSRLLGDTLPLYVIPVPDEATGVSGASGQAIGISPLLLLSIPVNLVFHFASVLVAWHDMSAGKSLFFSLVACLRNWRPLLMTLLAFILAGMFALLSLGLLGGDTGEMLRTFLATLLCLIFLSTLYATFYASYRDIFGRRDA